MFDNSSVIVGLEIGTSKVCAVVGELNADGALNIIGVGQAKSRGVRKGEITDATAVEEDVRNAIVEAEQSSEMEIRSVYLGVSGAHIRSFSNRGVHPVASADREITDEDVQDVVKNAKAVNLPHENHILQTFRQHFTVDGQQRIANPVGLLGARLEVEVHVVHGNMNRLQNAVLAVKGLQLDVEEVVFNGLASSLALLTREQKELGSLVIDLGGGTTDYTVSVDGIIKHTGVLAVGGDHVTNDLAIGLKIALGRAEGLSSNTARRCRTKPLAARPSRFPARWACLRRPSTSIICAASCTCGWRKFSTSSARIWSVRTCSIICAAAFSCAAAGRASPASPDSRSRFLACTFPWAKQIPSAASRPRLTSRSSRRPSVW